MELEAGQAQPNEVRASNGEVVVVSELWRAPRVLQETGFSSLSPIYELMQVGQFPKAVSITGGRAVAWPSHLVLRWIADRIVGVPLAPIDRAALRSARTIEPGKRPPGRPRKGTRNDVEAPV